MNNKLRINPNPTADFTIVDLSEFKNLKDLSLYLTNSESKELKSFPVQGEKLIKINLRNYPAGVYFIRLQSGVEILGVEKVIKI